MLYHVTKFPRAQIKRQYLWTWMSVGLCKRLMLKWSPAIEVGTRSSNHKLVDGRVGPREQIVNTNRSLHYIPYPCQSSVNSYSDELSVATWPAQYTRHVFWWPDDPTCNITLRSLRLRYKHVAYLHAVASGQITVHEAQIGQVEHTFGYLVTQLQQLQYCDFLHDSAHSSHTQFIMILLLNFTNANAYATWNPEIYWIVVISYDKTCTFTISRLLISLINNLCIIAFARRLHYCET